MLTQRQIIIREATTQEDLVIAHHFYQMWQDMGILEDAINPDWHHITLKYIDMARRDLFYKAFVAEVDDVIIGSASCQIFAGLYPNIFQPEYRKSGYIWGVYVEPSYRRQGIAKQLTSIAVEYLKAIACTQVVLNASPAGKPVYSSLNFSEGNQMILNLVVSASAL
ncbi:GNAT family N-acetyltransferase [Scytonema hofmannii FACHB-248]|uniref:GNAT family N-acetyltransferase n=2 Tax=Scytonema hofmannii TaxID=34078 RepID=A0ABR8GW02_9CYAN|nr:GNAT family N-acetyltransferase [[Scytonema hofmanni] UTEX B 1581]MBD2607697.1 GNAT family N-acetyltransferase [Scytonema hofmannii FACHB-248]